MLLAAGCGGEPGLPSALAEQLSASSESVAAQLEARDFCAARATAVGLQRRTIAAVNSGRVPPELQEELLGSVNALLATISCAPPRAGARSREDAEALADWLRENS